ncbi:hypothetical protein CYMTET_56552 [Cymbomonas tetramitiformis]|uniref:Uncharacterized protein n=1 Tax=Cymbomonas tetramitiformis TaxID=36881 RepID=A0AAE0BB25_9CHLO|nr:hypothetical protein CYMTET_56552 [Cymbomonas tetramitiformis]
MRAKRSMERTSGSCIDKLSLDALLHVLLSSGLSYIDVANACCVSRTWRAVIFPGAAAIVALDTSWTRWTVKREALHALGRLIDRGASEYSDQGTNFESMAIHLREIYVRSIAKSLENVEWNVKRAAVETIRKLGQHIAPFTGEIASRLQHGNEEVRRATVEALGKLQLYAAPYALEVANCIQDPDRYVRWAVVEACDRMKEHMAPHIWVFLNNFQNADNHVRWVSVEATNRLKSYAAPHVELIARRLEDEESYIRRTAMQLLLALGNDAAPYAGSIATRLQDSETYTRWLAVQALNKLPLEFVAPHSNALRATMETFENYMKIVISQLLERLTEATQ